MLLYIQWLGTAVMAAQPLNGGFLHANGRGELTDELGRVRILHGVNRVRKAPPWYFVEQTTSDDEFALMQELGLTALRLGFMWSGYNPAPGIFNKTYIDTIHSIIERASRHGIYVLLDMHQDCFSSNFCLYDGVPQWVANKSTPRHSFPWPFTGNCSSRGWGENCLTEAAATAYQDLYDNKNGMLDDLGAFWAEAATHFASVPAVLGYEIMNEPFAGDFYAKPDRLLPGIAGATNLQRMHDAVAARIRQHDRRHLVFYEPVTWGMIFDEEAGGVIGSGFEHVPGGAQFANRSVFSFHYYCKSFAPSGKPRMQKILCDDAIAPLIFAAVAQETARLGGAAMMTEGLSCDYDDPGSAAECVSVLARLDAHLLSWTDYALSQGSTWSPSASTREGWARTHARAVAGRPINMTFDASSKDFEFCYVPDPAVRAPTEIFASVRYSYSCGRVVSATSNLAVTGAATDDVLHVAPVTAQGSEQQWEAAAGCVWIRRAAAHCTHG